MAAVIALGLRTLRIKDNRLNRLVWVMYLALALQIVLGVTNVLFRIPLAVAVAHNAGAGILLLSVVTLATQVWLAEGEETEES